MGWRLSISPVICALFAAAFLASCEGVVDDVKESPTAQLVGLVQDQPCVITPREGRRLAGAYLRQPVAALGFDPVFIDGRINRRGLKKNIQFDDTAIRRLRPLDDDGFKGSRKSEATARSGFGPTDQLPNVYDLNYRTKKVNYQGPLVVGPGPAATEIPTTGKAVFTGPVALQLHAFDDEGGLTTQEVQARFRFEAGYGSGRGSFTIFELPTDGRVTFSELTWTELFLCGARFVSSGQGEVQVSVSGARRYPFQTGREPVPLRASFEASQFAPMDRPGPPQSFGGILIIESDLGTISAVFLSDDPPEPAPEAASE